MAKKRKVRKAQKKAGNPKRKIYVVTANLVLFAVLSLICFLFYRISSNSFYETLFFLLTIGLSFVSVALFISLLVLVVMKGLKKK